MVRYLAVIAALTALVFVGVSGIARADLGTVMVTGDVNTRAAFTMDGLRALPSRTDAVTFNTKAGPESHTYTGCSLDAVVTQAQPVGDAAAKHPLLSLAILATGADGYSAALAWGEVSESMAPKPPMVAYAEDGNPLEQPRLVVPADTDGARYVRDLAELQVVNLAAH
jgi:DMSO/TMAO reductase YedYZ molybdopterin-dependent catalytic subunit